MNIELSELKAVWESISEKAAGDTDFASLTRVLQRQQRWLRQYREFADEFQSLWIVELLEFVAEHSTFSETDISRAAERARYAIRRAIKRSTREVSETEYLLDRSVDSGTQTEELTAQIYDALKDVLDDEELVLLNFLFFKSEGTSLSFPASALYSKIHRLRKKIEPIVKSVLGKDRHSN